MSIGKILILENEEVVAQQLLEPLRERGEEVRVVATVAAARASLAQAEVDLVISEATLPDGSAADLLGLPQTTPAPPPLVVISEFGSVESAVECLRQGALAYLLKPFSGTQVEVVLQKVEEHLRLVQLSRLLSRESEADGGWELLGESSAMQVLRQTIRQVARTDATVLITGESGTGKERVARAIYQQSPRAPAPLLKVDCAGLPEAQLAVEMFGQEKGAGTPGGGSRPGRFELAEHGTVLLDEISELMPDIQGGLLRVLQDRTVQRLGGSRLRPVDVRVLATTSRPLEDFVQRKQFREDLYLRLNIVPVAIPPLRERKSDIPLLAEHFRQRFIRKHGSSALAISPECLAALQRHSWPGNVRELKNVIERAVMACVAGNVLEPVHLDSLVGRASTAATPVAPAPVVEVPDDLGEVEKRHILAIVQKYGGNRTHAARQLGISIRTLRNKLKEYRTADATADAQPNAAESEA